MLKKILIAVLLVLSTGCTTTHSFMDKAMIGYVEGQTIVMFPAGELNSVKMYRPQFHSNCGKVYNKIYQMDNGSTGCMVRESRIADLHPYREH